MLLQGACVTDLCRWYLNNKTEAHPETVEVIVSRVALVANSGCMVALCFGLRAAANRADACNEAKLEIRFDTVAQPTILSSMSGLVTALSVASLNHIGLAWQIASVVLHMWLMAPLGVTALIVTGAYTSLGA